MSRENSQSALAELSSEELLRRWKTGTHAAADILVERHAMRLVGIVADRMNRRWQSAAGPEDVVQSAMGSFFAAVSDSRIRASQVQSVSGLLVAIAKRKMLRKIEHESAQKRRADGGQVDLDDLLSLPSAGTSQPDLDDLWELLELAPLAKRTSLRPMLECLLAGHTQAEVAVELGISERTVRRELQRLYDAANPGKRRSPAPTKEYVPVQLPRIEYREFVLSKLVGSGALGKVYRARLQTGNSQAGASIGDIAIKFLRKRFWQQARSRDLFLREVDKAAAVSQQHVVRYLGWGQSPHGGPYIAQEYVDGCRLTDRLDVSYPQFLTWLAEIVEGLAAIHSAGIIHGDVTPNNVLISGDGRVKLTDFGFSTALLAASDATALTLMGTPGFAAPEQISEAYGPVGVPSDIYAVGAIVRWYLANRCSHAWLETSRGKRAPGPSQLAALDAFAVRCTQEIPSSRPESANEVSSMVERLRG